MGGTHLWIVHVPKMVYVRGFTLIHEEIGMDHFALPHDGLSKAMRNGTLHRR